MDSRTFTSALALLLTCSVMIGCGGSGSRSKSSNAAPATSNTNTTPTPPAAPNPGGGISALTTAGTPLQAQLETDAYVAFKENVSVSDLVIADQPGLEETAFVMEDDGTLRVLDLNGASPVLDRSFNLFPAPLAAGVATGGLTIQSSNLALVTTSGNGGEGVSVFDPLAATTTAHVTNFDLNGITATWPSGTLNSAGADVSGAPVPMSYVSGAVIAGGKLIYCSSNLDASFNNNPGTMTAFDIDLGTMTLSGGGFWQTSDFNPTGLTRLQTPQGEVVLCTNTGAFGTAGSSIDVLDPTTFAIVGTIQFPSTAVTAPVGRIVVSPDGKRGYIGSQSAAQVFVLDLENIGQDLAGSRADLSARYLGGYEIPTQSATNFISSVALSDSGNWLYAANFNESAVYAIDLTAPELGAKVVGFQRTGTPANYEGLANTIAVRPGTPGTDFQGPSIHVLTINLAAADRTVTDVTVALDRITVDRH